MGEWIISRTDGSAAPHGPFADRDAGLAQIAVLTERFPTHEYWLAEVDGRYAREIGPVRLVVPTSTTPEVKHE